MFIDMFMIVIIFNTFCNIPFTSQIPLQSTNKDQLITITPTAFNQYRENSVHEIITDDHISTILKKFGSTALAFSTENFTLTNQTSSVPPFETKHLPIDPDATAQDGSLVRLLPTTISGSMGQFDLPSGKISHADEHRSVYEMWYFLSGQGELWRKQNDREEIVTVNSDLCITIPVGTLFQFRTIGRQSLVAVAITMRPWPGDSEAMLRPGIWNASSIAVGNSSTKLVDSIYLFVIIVTFFLVKML